MSSNEQERISEAVMGNPPHPDATLVGWVVIAEWEIAERERLLSRLWNPDSSSWQVKGYLHEALFGSWPDANGTGPGSQWRSRPS